MTQKKNKKKGGNKLIPFFKKFAVPAGIMAIKYGSRHLANSLRKSKKKLRLKKLRILKKKNMEAGGGKTNKKKIINKKPQPTEKTKRNMKQEIKRRVMLTAAIG